MRFPPLDTRSASLPLSVSTPCFNQANPFPLGSLTGRSTEFFWLKGFILLYFIPCACVCGVLLLGKAAKPVKKKLRSRIERRASNVFSWEEQVGSIHMVTHMKGVTDLCLASAFLFAWVFVISLLFFSHICSAPLYFSAPTICPSGGACSEYI
ncbi:hypothetical protein BDZ94DRAFT_1262316 [Collybia nuda]|uniref:Uncharacterized protein n=1 Tax=Collybia nuda TaxID=64659 RepID=A0A9P5Y4G5_9AGAR|nr:hypothetical protein BDZ94DRAFT_1262316 [Collybia nuda]